MRALTVAGLLLTGLATGACVDVSLLAGGSRAEGSFTRTLTVAGPVTLDVSTGSGSIVVRSGQAGSVRIEGRIKASQGGIFGLTSLSPEERVRRIEQDPPIEQSGGRIRIGQIEEEALKRGLSISYTLTVPSDASLQSRTGSGSQDVSGLDGPVDVSTGSGSIRVRDAGGDVRASTGSGSIAADRVAGAFEARAGSGSIQGTAIGRAVTVKTGSGGIRVSQDGSGDVEATAGSGSIELSGVRAGVRATTGSGSLTVQGEQRSDWRLATSSGSVTIELEGAPAFNLDATGGRIDTSYPVNGVSRLGPRELRGAVNGGGPLLRVHTSSGRISIR